MSNACEASDNCISESYIMKEVGFQLSEKNGPVCKFCKTIINSTMKSVSRFWERPLGFCE